MPAAVSIFDDPTGNGQPAAAPPSQPAAPPPQLVPSYADFYAQLGNAAAAQYRANPTNLFAWLTGSGSDAARQAAQVGAPDAYFKMLAAQQGVQSGQIDLAQTLEVLKRAGFDPTSYLAAINGNVPQGGVGSTQGASQPAGATTADPAAPTVPPSAPGALHSTVATMPGMRAVQASPAAPVAASTTPATAVPPAVAAPTGAPPAGAPSQVAGLPGAPIPSPPAGSPASPPPVSAGATTPAVAIPTVKGAPPAFAPPGAGSDPLQARRAFLMQTAANLAGMPKYQPIALQMMQAARTGLPQGTDVDANGQVVDTVTRQPVTINTQAYAAQGAGLVSGAQARAQQPYTIAAQNNQAANQRATDAARITGEAQNKLLTGFDKTTGQPATATAFDVAHGNAPNFVEGTNPYFAGQQEELKGLRTDAADADQGLQLALQVQNAANGVYTGTGASNAQDIRKLAQTAAWLMNIKLPDELNNTTSKFEQLKFASQQLVAKASHSLSPRVAQSIYAQINAVKPGDKTSVQGLRDIITNEIIPALARQKAVFGATASYYQKNPLRNDAAAVVPGQLNVSDFRVKTDPRAVQPGDYYLDPISANIRQRPVQ